MSSLPNLAANTSNNNVHHSPSPGRSEKDQLWRCLPLYRALLRGDQCDLELAARPMGPLYKAWDCKITRAGDTTLHVIVGAGKWFDDPTVGPSAYTSRNNDGYTPLCVAAMVGNMEAAKNLLQLNPGLGSLDDAVGPYPIIEAVRYGHKEMVLLLIGDMERKMEGSPPTKQSTASHFLHLLVVAGFYDVLLALLRRHPGLARAEFYGDNNESLLSLLAEIPSAFRSGTQLRFWHWQQLLYSGIMIKSMIHAAREIWKTTTRTIRHIKDTKLMHEETLDIVKRLCEELTKHYSSTGEDIEPVLRKALLSAAGSGISEIIEEIIERYPDAIWFVDSENHNLFHLAVINRYEKVFSLIYQLSVYKHLVTAGEDTSGNNILHMAGKLAPLSRLNLISGAALQMQRELQWFQEVEKFVQPTLRTKRNSDGKTPKMVFTEEHKELVKEGEKWMKETANSCIFVAALTTTVVFAAAITVPGGNNQNSGFPLFSNETAFTAFAVSAAFCLFSSVASVLMFLSILTSRYAEGDFLRRLPKRLILGLGTLFISMTSLMIAFSATIYLVFGQRKGWILIPVGIAALIPVILFESLQFPLLLDMFMSTYGPSIFRKQSSRILL
ncbi:uncharacterized protein LOC107794692 isoform X6 [Nicotiana tabacum]|uniref:Ankyrin repeat-containing protein At3g12360 isoform X5 n=1 Tax=Nicotiana tabacum TaxID=4097 RepID=A0A1S4A7W4_TOBAC|nr:PREDICTED: ankyrin repeat-containing protein At3g12360-like isoform X5 [Nicotiana tabacum]XP_018634110.1 ankyrin repeat-containing protein NPR4-like isoform X3 [Nicotiana tomentosiformis]